MGAAQRQHGAQSAQGPPPADRAIQRLSGRGARADDPRTALNRPLLEALEQQPGTLLVAGEALSHCVAASVQDLINRWDVQRLQRTVLLTDCMSPVPGFEAIGRQLEAARACGVRTRRLPS